MQSDYSPIVVPTGGVYVCVLSTCCIRKHWMLILISRLCMFYAALYEGVELWCTSTKYHVCECNSCVSRSESTNFQHVVNLKYVTFVSITVNGPPVTIKCCSCVCVGLCDLSAPSNSTVWSSLYNILHAFVFILYAKIKTICMYQQIINLFIWWFQKVHFHLTLVHNCSQRGLLNAQL